MENVRFGTKLCECGVNIAQSMKCCQKCEIEQLQTENVLLREALRIGEVKMCREVQVHNDRLILTDADKNICSFALNSVSKVKGTTKMVIDSTFVSLTEKVAHDVDCILFPNTYKHQFEEKGRLIDELAKIAYEGYCEHTDNKSAVTGCDLPVWENLPSAVQEAWAASTTSVINHWMSST